MGKEGLREREVVSRFRNVQRRKVSGKGFVAMLGTSSMDKHCIACLPRSMEDALYIHEVLQRNGHRNRGRRC